MSILASLLQAGAILTAILTLFTNMLTSFNNEVIHSGQPPTSSSSTEKTYESFSNEVISFTYPSTWKLETLESTHSIYGSIKATSPKTDSGLPIFAMYIYQNSPGRGRPFTFDEFDDIYVPGTPIVIDGHQARRTHIILTPKRLVASERVVISIPERSLFIQLTYRHTGKADFDEEVALYMDPLIESIKLK